MFEHKLGL